MKSEEEFDELLRNKFSDESAFPFEEDKWARMEEMIMADEAKKKRRKFFFIFFSGFITALFFVIPFVWYLFNSNEIKEERKLKTENTGSSTNKNLDGTKGSNNSNENNVETNKINSVAASGGDSSNQTTNDKNTIEKTKSSEENLNGNSIASNQKVNYSVSSNKKTVKRNNSSSKNNKTNLTLNTENDIVKGKSEDNHEREIKDNRVNQVSNADISSTETNTNENKVSIETNNSKTTIDSTYIAKKDSITEQKNNISEVEKPDSLLENTDSISKFAYFLNFGAQYNLGFSKFQDGNSLSPYLGGSFQYQFSKNWAFNSGLGVYMLYNFAFEHEITQISYDFGYRAKVMNIVPEQMYYLTTSFEICRIVNKNSFAFGLQPTFLVANRSNVFTYEQTSLSFSENKSIHSFKHGYGLNSFDLQLSLTYSRYLKNNKWLIGGTCGIGLLDVRKMSWTENSTFERNQFVRFNLIYKIK